MTEGDGVDGGEGGGGGHVEYSARPVEEQRLFSVSGPQLFSFSLCSFYPPFTRL